MFDRATALDIIDRAFDAQRVCEACGAPTMLRDEGSTVVLECSARAADANVLEKIEDFLMPHTRRVVIDLAKDAAA